MAESVTTPAADGEVDGPAREQDESFALSDVPGTADRPPEERGTLDLRSKAVSHLAQHAAAEVAGTVRSGSALSRTSGGALGTSYPSASAHLDGGRATIDVDVAVTWPAPVADVARRTRDHVLSRSRELSGLEVRHVDVTVHVVSATADTDDERRVE